MSYNTILVESVDEVTTITFNRPEQRNAMNPEMHVEMVDALAELADDDGTRVLVVTGAGTSFSAGQDLKEYFYDIDHDTKKRKNARQASRTWRSYLLRHFPKPTIAAVNGHCFGGAFTIVTSCDFAFAGSDAVFGLSEVNFGKIAGGHVTKALKETLHPRDALYYLMTGESFGAEEAARIKLVTKHVPQDHLMSAVRDLADTLRKKNPDVLRATKEAYKYLGNMDWEQSGAWLEAKSAQLDGITGKSWKRGVEQFKDGQYRPGHGEYNWKEN